MKNIILMIISFVACICICGYLYLDIPFNNDFINACAEGDCEEVEKILKQNDRRLDEIGYDGWIPITLSTANGKSEVVRILLRHGCSPLDSGPDGIPALFYAWIAKNQAIQIMFIQYLKETVLTKNDIALINRSTILPMEKANAVNSRYYKEIKEILNRVAQDSPLTK